MEQRSEMVPLVGRAQAGDPEAVAELFDRYRLRLVRFCLTFWPLQEADAQDLTQDIFIRVFRGIGKLKKAEVFESWLWTIARLRCISYLRATQQRCVYQGRLADETDTTGAETPNLQQREVERLAVMEEIQAMQPSPPLEAGKMFYLDGMDTGTIASRLQVPVSTVTTWLSRFRGRIRKRLILRILELRGQETNV
jgi:RNA polymerase sigma-70 factor, ECF subfamily